MSDFINYNGKLQKANEPVLLADDRAYRYGYGLYETMLYLDGCIRLENFHFERLISGLDLLQIQTQKDFWEELLVEISRTAIKNKIKASCRVRVQISGGNGGINEAFPSKANYLIETFVYEAPSGHGSENGFVVGLSDYVKHTGSLANLKSSAGLPYILAARQAREALWNDALLLNEHGRPVESTIANLFWIKNSVVYTPPLSEGCVAGVMRRHLLNILPNAGIQVVEQPAAMTDLMNSDQIFLSNAIKMIIGVTVLSGKTLKRDVILMKELYKILSKSF